MGRRTTALWRWTWCINYNKGMLRKRYIMKGLQYVRKSKDGIEGSMSQTAILRWWERGRGGG